MTPITVEATPETARTLEWAFALARVNLQARPAFPDGSRTYEAEMTMDDHLAGFQQQLRLQEELHKMKP